VHRAAEKLLPGSNLENERLIEIAKKSFSGRRFSIVRHWTLIDVMLRDLDAKAIEAEGAAPVVLYAQDTVYDSGKGNPSGMGVVSSFQIKSQDCFFETRDMLYMLAGRGVRKTAGNPALEALMHHCRVEAPLYREKYRVNRESAAAGLR
jgi:hypothetical protein